MKINDTVFHHTPMRKPTKLKIVKETPKQWICDNNQRFWKKGGKAVGFPWPMLGSFISKQ